MSAALTQMYAVRGDKGAEPGGYVFTVTPTPGSLEMVALDSSPGIIAFVRATDPGAACAKAWEMAAHMYDQQPEQLQGDLP